MSAHRVLPWSENSLSALRTPEECLHPSECTTGTPVEIKVAFGGGDDLFELGASAGQSTARAVAAAQLAGRRRRQAGRVQSDRDPVNTAAPVEGCIRETGDKVQITDPTPEPLSTLRLAFERVRR